MGGNRKRKRERVQERSEKKIEKEKEKERKKEALLYKFYVIILCVAHDIRLKSPTISAHASHRIGEKENLV